MEYRVWYTPYGYPGESDYIEIEAESEQEARMHGAVYGWVESVETIRR